MFENDPPSDAFYKLLKSNELLLRGIYCFGFDDMFPVQHIILNSPHKKSSLIQYRSGMGKTCGLIIKILKEVNFERPHLQGLLLVPTIYLADQIGMWMDVFTEYLSRDMKKTMVLRNGYELGHVNMPKVIITTPQLAIQHNIDVSELVILGIDEMDVMLEIGGEFRKYIRLLFSKIPKETEIVCVGTQSPSPECYLHEERLKNSYIHNDKMKLNEKIVEKFVYCPRSDQKINWMKDNWVFEPYCSTIVFCNTRERTENVTELLKQVSPLFRLFQEDVLILKFSSPNYMLPMNAVDTDEGWDGIKIHSINSIIHFDVNSNRERSILRSSRCGKGGMSVYLPSTLEELDFVFEMVLGSANSSHQRVMMRSLQYSDISIVSH